MVWTEIYPTGLRARSISFVGVVGKTDVGSLEKTRMASPFRVLSIIWCFQVRLPLGLILTDPQIWELGLVKYEGYTYYCILGSTYLCARHDQICRWNNSFPFYVSHSMALDLSDAMPKPKCMAQARNGYGYVAMYSWRAGDMNPMRWVRLNTGTDERNGSRIELLVPCPVGKQHEVCPR